MANLRQIIWYENRFIDARSSIPVKPEFIEGPKTIPFRKDSYKTNQKEIEKNAPDNANCYCLESEIKRPLKGFQEIPVSIHYAKINF
jgi:hypothetical protein